MQEVLYSKLQRLKEEVKYLGDHKAEFVRTLKTSTETRKIVERTVYLCAEIVLDIADLLILKKGYPKPSTYSDSIFKLGDYRIVPKDFAYKFVYIAGIRNFLAHDEQDDDYYSSYAKGKTRPDSDIDVAVVSKHFGRDRVEEGMNLFRIAGKIDPRIEPIPISSESYEKDTWIPLIYEIKQKGIEVEL